MDGNRSSARVMKMKTNLKLRRIVLLTFLSVLFSFSVSAQERQLLPIDEAGKDASFKAFRDKLISAVQKKDAKYLLSVMDPNIKNGFGDSNGIANFKKHWKIDSPNSEMWEELLFVLTHGGAFQTEGKNKTFTAPYVYSNFPENLDAFEYSAITDKNVNLRATPFTSAPSVATLSYNIVKVDYEGSVKNKSNTEKYAWLKVETMDGKTGFVPEKFIRSSADYRAAFEKKRGLWKMTFFLAGD